MKKLVLYLFIQFCVFQLAVADELTPAQIRLRSSIQSFLKEEGFMPEVDSDGDIKFKREGRIYFISINPNDESPMYVSLFGLYSYPDDYPIDIVKLASLELNNLKCIKVYCLDSHYQIQAEMFLTDPEQFKYVFYRLISLISHAESDFLSECAKVLNTSSGQVPSTLSSRIPFIITSIEVGNVEQNGDLIQNYGSTIYDYKTQYLKPKLTISPIKMGTYTVYVRLYRDGVLQTGTSSPTGYSYSDTITISSTLNVIVYVSGWGSNKAGNWPAGKYRFEIWYGDYCLGSHSFSVI